MANTEIKISILTPKEELYALWRKLHLDSENEMQSEYPDRHASHSFFEDYQLAEAGLAAGTISKAELDKLLGRFDRYQGDLSDVATVASFWYSLSSQYPQINRELALEMWSFGVGQCKDPYHKAVDVAYFVDVVKPADGKERLEAVAEELREVLPPYEMIPLIFPWGEVDSTLEEKLEEIKSWGKKPSADNFSKVSSFVYYCKHLMVEMSDLDKYLLDALVEVDLTNCDGYVGLYLLYHMISSDLLREEKLVLLNLTLNKTGDMPRGLGFYDTVLEAAVCGFLKLSDFDQALLTWRRIEDETVSSSCLVGLIEYALTHGMAGVFRREYSAFGKISQLGDEGARRIWIHHWYMAANFLAGRGMYFMEEPEVIEWIRSGWHESDLKDVWNLCNDKRYMDKSGKLRSLVGRRVSLLIKKYNAGKLDEMESADLLETLMAMAG